PVVTLLDQLLSWCMRLFQRPLHYVQLRMHPFTQYVRTPCFTFPNHNGAPAELRKAVFVVFVPLDISSKFIRPKLHARLGDRRLRATSMPMPEASMNENGDAISRQYNVRASRQVSPMQAKAITLAEEHSPNDHFRSGIRLPDSGHQPRPSLRG